jgi:DNA polymerase III epsilon subunit-like protein
MNMHTLEYRQREKYPYRCVVCLRTWGRQPTDVCAGVPCYYWRQSPEYLQTFSQLRAAHLKPSNRKEANAYLWCHDEWWPLYDSREAIPRRRMSEKQRQAYLDAWKRTQANYTCQFCGSVPGSLVQLKKYVPGCCLDCLEIQNHYAMLDEDHQRAIRSARKLLGCGDTAAIIDTETTDLEGVVLEVAAIALDGTVLFHSLVNPECRVSPGARAVHGISDEELAAAPPLPVVWPRLVEALAGRTLLMSYNAEFDSGILDTSARRYGLEPLVQRWRCLMTLYAAYVGDWSDYWESYRWQPLNGGHRALEDCQAALGVLREMVASQEDEPSPERIREEEEVERMKRSVERQKEGYNAIGEREQQ